MTPTPETVDLLPCPHCGSSNVQSGGDDKVVGVWCWNCGATGPNGYLTINGDFDWNTRAALPVQEVSVTEAAKVLVNCDERYAARILNAGCRDAQIPVLPTDVAVIVGGCLRALTGETP